ncbi:hypothetical protein CSPHI_05720 [Corynebacterium sphenisci DSM 44792]|uniref:Uncharacterized protein n=1 Tax=Corynebacterium sphenisci DSM 44792 TaxID=1437874 RepID=A0A1L7CXU2_9CORY|nr:hypothetical protein [Corynebacterium sphenisci]APT90622.1 hypothetical protein CSPHI_05720 [Corynebacterium sphenisci DSM 44792]
MTASTIHRPGGRGRIPAGQSIPTLPAWVEQAPRRTAAPRRGAVRRPPRGAAAPRPGLPAPAPVRRRRSAGLGAAGVRAEAPGAVAGPVREIPRTRATVAAVVLAGAFLGGALGLSWTDPEPAPAAPPAHPVAIGAEAAAG